MELTDKVLIDAGFMSTSYPDGSEIFDYNYGGTFHIAMQKVNKSWNMEVRLFNQYLYYWADTVEDFNSFMKANKIDYVL